MNDDLLLSLPDVVDDGVQNAAYLLQWVLLHVLVQLPLGLRKETAKARVRPGAGHQLPCDAQILEVWFPEVGFESLQLCRVAGETLEGFAGDPRAFAFREIGTGLAGH